MWASRDKRVSAGGGSQFIELNRDEPRPRQLDNGGLIFESSQSGIYTHVLPADLFDPPLEEGTCVEIKGLALVPLIKEREQDAGKADLSLPG